MTEGLDFFGFRYMSSAQGRFTGPDPIAVTPERMLDPQRVNLYAYGRNNPLRYIDLDGRDVYLANDSEEYRRKALYSVTKNLSTSEQRNISYRKNADGKYELYVKGSSKIELAKASEGYQQLVGRINEHSVQINFSLVPTGGQVQGPEGAVTHQMLAGPGGSAGLTYVTRGTGNADVFVAEGGSAFGVAGLTASGRDVGIAFPEFIVTAHELFGETAKTMPGSRGLQTDPVADSVEVV